MRLAKCLGLTAPVTVMGSIASVVIVGPIGTPGDPAHHPGWHGDLDQVIGAEGFTLADGLGAELLQHFEIVTPEKATPALSVRRGGKSDTPAATPSEE